MSALFDPQKKQHLYEVLESGDEVVRKSKEDESKAFHLYKWFGFRKITF